MVKRIFISGLPRIGKTTLIRKFLEGYKGKVIGFLTLERKVKEKRVGFEIEILPEKEKILFASVNKISNIKFGRYYLNLKVLEKVIEGVETNLEGRDLLIIDEIGRMEMLSKRFREFIFKILHSKINLLAVLHRSYIKEFEKYGEVIWLKEENRNFVLNKIKKIYGIH